MINPGKIYFIIKLLHMNICHSPTLTRENVGIVAEGHSLGFV